LTTWLYEPEQLYFFQHQQTVKVLPATLAPALELLLPLLHVVEAGIALADITKNKLVPQHALAVSLALKKENFHSISVDLDTALDYLRKNNVNLLTDQKGFCLIEYDGLPLGWVNLLPNRANNLYPAEWRIRMG
ncbi:MAG: rRNA methyltransferase, partial [Cyclobacteriaceae bacterium]|nr:rRNA methyltransferase [Cyclobacteriaceae bacterium]